MHKVPGELPNTRALLMCTIFAVLLVAQPARACWVQTAGWPDAVQLGSGRQLATMVRVDTPPAIVVVQELGSDGKPFATFGGGEYIDENGNGIEDDEMYSIQFPIDDSVEGHHYYRILATCADGEIGYTAASHIPVVRWPLSYDPDDCGELVKAHTEDGQILGLEKNRFLVTFYAEASEDEVASIADAYGCRVVFYQKDHQYIFECAACDLGQDYKNYEEFCQRLKMEGLVKNARPYAFTRFSWAGPHSK